MQLTARIEKLYAKQLAEWPKAGENYDALQNVLVRTVRFDNLLIKLQFNPGIIISSSAKVDAESISQRPCFLCTINRPKEQDGITYGTKYLILINPYPIFSRHLTISTLDHLPQRISGNFPAMLHLAKDMPGYTIIYNGPNCGASAPDHFHFQAVKRKMLPIESEFEENLPETISVSINTKIYFLRNYLRRVVTICSNDESVIHRIFESVFRILQDSLPPSDEPMINIITWFEDGKWIIHIFPRKQHRPSQYFETGEKQILLSPASIDMGGVLIIPRERDYEKIKKDDIADIFNQVSVDDFFISVLMDRLKKEL